SHPPLDLVRVDEQLAGQLQLDQLTIRVQPGNLHIAVQLHRKLPLPGSIELDSEYRLPAPEQDLPVLDERRMRRHQQELPAVGVAVDRLVRGYPKTSPEIVMQIGSSNGSDSLQQSLEIAEQKRFVLVHRQAERR